MLSTETGKVVDSLQGASSDHVFYDVLQKEDDELEKNLVRLEGLRVYKHARPGGQNGDLG